MPTNVESIPPDPIPSDPSQFPPHWSLPGVYGIYNADNQLQYVAAAINVHDAIATHVRLINDPYRLHSVRTLLVADAEAAPLGEIAENWVLTHVEYEGIPPGNSDEAPEWREEEWKPDVYVCAGEPIEGEIRSLLRRNRVVLFMKGKRDAPRCGFSERTVAVLKGMLGDAFVCVDCLDERNGTLREEIKNYSQWPTIPQLFVDGDFVGGADIVAEMQQNGKLKKMLAPIIRASKASTQPKSASSPST